MDNADRAELALLREFWAIYEAGRKAKGTRWQRAIEQRKVIAERVARFYSRGREPEPVGAERAILPESTESDLSA